jgi:signal transduction histidine kinase
LADSLLDDPAISQATEETHKSISLIAESARRMSDLVNDILDLARLARSDVTLNKKAINLHNTVTEIFQLCAPIAKKLAPTPETMIEFVNEVPEDLVVVADEGRMKQILQNLVSNSVKVDVIKLSSNLKFMDYDKKTGKNYIKVQAKNTQNGSGQWVTAQVYVRF